MHLAQIWFFWRHELVRSSSSKATSFVIAGTWYIQSLLFEKFRGCPKLCCFEIANSNSSQISFLISDLFQKLCVLWFLWLDVSSSQKIFLIVSSIPEPFAFFELIFRVTPAFSWLVCSVSCCLPLLTTNCPVESTPTSNFQFGQSAFLVAWSLSFGVTAISSWSFGFFFNVFEYGFINPDPFQPKSNSPFSTFT